MPQTRPLDIPALNTTAAAQLAAIIQSSADAIVSKQLDGTVQSWNRSAERIFGYTAEEMVGTPIYRLIPPDLHQEEAGILARVAQGEQISYHETTRIRKDGGRITISLSASPVYDSEGRIAGVASIKRDITEYRRLEQILRQSAKMESVGRLAGGLAHDFNNNLHALSGFAHLIARDPALSMSARKDLLQIQKVAERMASLTHQLLAFARQQVLAPQTVDVGDTVADALPMLQRLIGTNYTLELDQSGGQHWVRVDPAQLVQVLMNLVTNARDAMPEGGRILLRTAVMTVDSSVLDMARVLIPPGDYVFLEVTDHGSGISPHDLAHLFEPFYTTKEVGRGTGLGLATVEGIISQSKGHIQIETALEKGSTFRVLLPVSQPAEAKKIAGPAAKIDQEPQRRVLVVDDDENVRHVISRMLELDGYAVSRVGNGQEALDFLNGGAAVDLVVTDIVMPVMGGVELTERLARQYPELPVVWMSGHPSGTGPNEVHSKPGQLFMQKPIKPALLLETVSAALGRHHS